MNPRITLIELLELPVDQLPGIAIVDEVVTALRTTSGYNAIDIARHLDAPVRDLNSAIRLLTGVSLDQIVKAWRKQQAICLLSESDTDFEEIAHRCGFKSVHNLSLHLNRETGLTAYEWRNKRSNAHRTAGAKASAKEIIGKL